VYEVVVDPPNLDHQYTRSADSSEEKSDAIHLDRRFKMRGDANKVQSSKFTNNPVHSPTDRNLQVEKESNRHRILLVHHH
tara:strand:+ start:725 stop:964 length:240 start_codon:yes stop_codon:yes gene_type:complete